MFGQNRKIDLERLPGRNCRFIDLAGLFSDLYDVHAGQPPGRLAGCQSDAPDSGGTLTFFNSLVLAGKPAAPGSRAAALVLVGDIRNRGIGFG